MSRWHAGQAPGRSARAMISVTLLAVLLVAAVPVALLAAVIMMMVGYVVGGLALFGGSVLAAGLAVVLAGLSGRRQLRKLLSGESLRGVRLDGSPYTETPAPEASEHPKFVRLHRSEYNEVR